MKKFRDEEVLGWRIVESIDRQRFESDINVLMEEYEFLDFQFSTTLTNQKMEPIIYTAAILIKEKD